MAINMKGARDESQHESDYSRDEAWELPELAPVLIIVSVGLLVLGSAISTWMSFEGQAGFGAGIGWVFVSSALRWVDPSTSTMLLISAALIWWQYGHCGTQQNGDLAKEVIAAHISRLRSIAKWNLIAFVVTTASVVLLIVASILQNTYAGATIAIWANSIDTFCGALGTILLSLLGIVGLRRVLTASHWAILGGTEGADWP